VCGFGSGNFCGGVREALPNSSVNNREIRSRSKKSGPLLKRSGFLEEQLIVENAKFYVGLRTASREGLQPCNAICLFNIKAL